jgi:hypothetical protein
MRINHRISALVVGLILAQVTTAQDQPRATSRLFRIPANTTIRVRTKNEISSDSARVGDDVQMEVLGDVIVNGLVVVPQGASAIGQISRAKEARSMGRRGNVALTLTYVEAVTGEHLLVGGSRAEKGKGKAAKMTTEIVATTLLTGGIVGALWLFEKGHDTSIPPGTAFSVYTIGDTTIDLANLPASYPAGTINIAQATPSERQSTSVVPLPRSTSSSSMTIPALGIVVATRANYGVEITGVARGSVAEKAGLQAGNIITQVDRVRVWTAADLAAALLNRPPSSRVAVGYVFMSTALGYMPKEIFFNLERAH